ncbi:sodium-dependent transporter [Pseudomaricurvus alkylphenolicus]|jgi:NSS family neurotransmitter:Na+ symporter|uniref:sodium-dependent transporter n=1 Tax=Pseudomaricurvus alkylphenolicus TaxID=1306991 RepID=UPI00141EC8D9|nr:sodium-dependent transporter [Pseudomaricurvus alkylphenolicus]NIB44615.1 sodium-dependent transporter [Pseudomaricurvus alkylphenolicus]
MTANREQFGSRLGFILAAAGSAVGIGNLVGFPVNAAKNGGAAFLLLYALFVFLICLPVMMAELAAGRNSRKNPLGAYQHFAPDNKLWHIGGWLSLVTPYMIAVFYAVITLWVLGYLVAILNGELEALTTTEYFGNFINSPSIFIYLALIAVMVGVILHFGVKEGIERGAKIMMPSLFIMLLGLVVFVLTRDNAMAGVQYYLIPDVSKIDAKVINGAMGQAFFSLSLGMGILITYGSYVDRQASIANSAKMVALADTGVAFTAGLLVLPAIFSFNPNVNTAELSDSSVSLIFTFLPKIFLAMQASVGYWGASIVAAIFFLLVFFAALTSLVSIIEVPVSGVMDQKGVTRHQALLMVGSTMVVVALACAVSFGMVDFFTSFIHYGGASKSFFDLVIDVFYDTILPLNGFLICMLVVYRWKKAQLNKELEQGDPEYKGSLAERYINFSLGTFIPVILLFVFINTVLNKFFSMSLI